ncbi:MAG: hypothetical protein AAF787_12430 [Chloroflexota bacterium]
MQVNDLVQILTRKPLSPAQINLLKCIRDAGVVGISKHDLADKMRDGNVRSVNGIFLALSRRIDESGETSCPEFFNYFEPRYCMHPKLWLAIKRLPRLRKLIENNTVEEIYDRINERDGLKLNPQATTV